MELHLTGEEAEGYIKYKVLEQTMKLREELFQMKGLLEQQQVYVLDLEERLHQSQPKPTASRKTVDMAAKGKDITAEAPKCSPKTAPFKSPPKPAVEPITKYPIETQVVALIKLAADSKLPPSQRTVAYMKAKSSKSESSIRKTIKMLGFTYEDGLITKAQ